MNIRNLILGGVAAAALLATAAPAEARPYAYYGRPAARAYYGGAYGYGGGYYNRGYYAPNYYARPGVSIGVGVPYGPGVGVGVRSGFYGW